MNVPPNQVQSIEGLPLNYQEIFAKLLEQHQSGLSFKIGDQIISLNIMPSTVQSNTQEKSSQLESRTDPGAQNSNPPNNQESSVKGKGFPTSVPVNAILTQAIMEQTPLEVLNRISSEFSNPSPNYKSQRYPENQKRINFNQIQMDMLDSDRTPKADSSSLDFSNTNSVFTALNDQLSQIQSGRDIESEKNKSMIYQNSDLLPTRVSKNFSPQSQSKTTELNDTIMSLIKPLNNGTRIVTKIETKQEEEKTSNSNLDTNSEFQTKSATLGNESERDEEEERDRMDINQMMAKLKENNPEISSEIKLIESYLKQREIKVKKKERRIEEQQKALADHSRTRSISSTQKSTETHSTGLNKTSKEMEALLYEILNEGQPEADPVIPPDLTTESNLHLCFLFSAPLVINYRDSNAELRKKPIYIEVDYRSELQSVKNILSSTRCEVKFKSLAASQSGLAECLNMKPRAIHFCGHGVENNKENFGELRNSHDGDYLIFEDESGRADFLSCKALKSLLLEKKLDHAIDFVFVASCHSHLVGEVFCEAGARHVICVSKNEKISDSACQKFTKAFYNAYFNGQYTICDAFKQAQSQLRHDKDLKPGEANKFMLLIREDDEFNEHICTTKFFSKPSPGEEPKFWDLTSMPKFSKIPSRVEHFLGRHLETQEIINLILNQRFVTINGAPGIGKTSLAKEVVNYAIQRNMFHDGIISLSLHSCESIEAVVSFLDSNLGYLSKNVSTKKESKGNLITQVCEHLKEKCGEVLIVFDDADQALNNDRGSFRELVEIILLTCSKIKILITSRTSVGGGLQGFTEKVFNLSHLDKMNAKELFILRAPRVIQDLEIKELIDYHPTQKEQEYIESLHSAHDDATHSLLGGDQDRFWSKPAKINIDEQPLEDHLIMGILGGHPQSISLAAALLVDRSLKDLFRLLTSRPLFEVLAVPDLTEDERKSFNSLQVSLDVSIDHLLKRNREAVRFFGLVGLLPAGASEVEFDKLWGTGWQELAGVLVRSSLLLRTTKKLLGGKVWFSLYPFMTNYAEEKLDQKDRIHFSEEIVKHLVEKGYQFFNKLGTTATDSESFFQEFLLEEPNFKACIYRELHANRLLTRPRASLQNSLLGTSGLLTNSNSGEGMEVLSLTKDSLKLLDKFNKTKQHQHTKVKKSNFVLLQNSDLNSERSQPKEEEKILVTENMANALSFHGNRHSSVWEYSSQSMLVPNDDAHQRVDLAMRNSCNEKIDITEGRASLLAIKNKRESYDSTLPYYSLLKDIDAVVDQLNKENSQGSTQIRSSTGSRYLKTPSAEFDSPPEIGGTDSINAPPKLQAGRLAVYPKIREANEPRTSLDIQISQEKTEISSSNIDSSNIINPRSQNSRGELKSPNRSQRDVSEDESKSEMLTSTKSKRSANEEMTKKPCKPYESTGLAPKFGNFLSVPQPEHRRGSGKSSNDRSRDDISDFTSNSQLDEDEHEEQNLEPICDLEHGNESVKDKSVASPKSPRSVSNKEDETENVKPKIILVNRNSGGRSSGSFQGKKPKKGRPPLKVTSNLKDLGVHVKQEPKKPEPACLENKKNRMKTSCHLMLIYSSILFMLRRYGECEKMIEHGESQCSRLNDKLSSANFKKLRACVSWIKKEYEASYQSFSQSLEEFKEVGCSLGIAICEAAIGYATVIHKDDKSGAIKKFEAALKIYKNLDHVFGSHYLHRWLGIAMSKFPNLRTQSKIHSEEAKRILQIQKKSECLGSKHKGGVFVVRWRGDCFSVFLEIASFCELDHASNHQKKNSMPIAQYPAKEEIQKLVARNQKRLSAGQEEIRNFAQKVGSKASNVNSADWKISAATDRTQDTTTTLSKSGLSGQGKQSLQNSDGSNVSQDPKDKAHSNAQSKKTNPGANLGFKSNEFGILNNKSLLFAQNKNTLISKKDPITAVGKERPASAFSKVSAQRQEEKKIQNAQLQKSSSKEKWPSSQQKKGESGNSTRNSSKERTEVAYERQKSAKSNQSAGLVSSKTESREKPKGTVAGVPYQKKPSEEFKPHPALNKTFGESFKKVVDLNDISKGEGKPNLLKQGSQNPDDKIDIKDLETIHSLASSIVSNKDSTESNALMKSKEVPKLQVNLSNKTREAKANEKSGSNPLTQPKKK